MLWVLIRSNSLLSWRNKKNINNFVLEKKKESYLEVCNVTNGYQFLIALNVYIKCKLICTVYLYCLKQELGEKFAKIIYRL